MECGEDYKTNIIDGNEKAASLTEQMNQVLLEKITSDDDDRKSKEVKDGTIVPQRKL